ncbi:hypothetical protein [Pseudoclavibacter helvolus]|uniref:hypothetical protein n=1 Tax=Pseudoclavibacter helvolus TaxID=255205 RepID=UPI003C74D3EA
MPELEKCSRCGEEAETRDNILGTTFWGSIQHETETVITKRLRILNHYYKHTETENRMMVADDKMALCGDCSNLLIARFLQGRSVPAIQGKESW